MKIFCDLCDWFCGPGSHITLTINLDYHRSVFKDLLKIDLNYGEHKSAITGYVCLDMCV